MPTVLIRHRIGSFAAWKAVFDGHAISRQANGSRGGLLFGAAGDPNDVLVLLGRDDVDRARLFLDSDDLREALTRAGVLGEPEVWLLEDVDRPTA